MVDIENPLSKKSIFSNLKNACVETVNNVSKILLTFYTLFPLIKASLKFQQKVGVFGEKVQIY
jgi:hypothetical protein